MEPVELDIPNGCLDAYEVKVNIDIFKYQEKVKLISQFQRFFSFYLDIRLFLWFFRLLPCLDICVHLAFSRG